MNSYRPQTAPERIALITAQEVHAGQRLNPYSGDGFIARPTAVALDLTKVGAKPDVISAGLLHAVPERSPIDGTRIIRSRFGYEILNLVSDVNPNPSLQDPSERYQSYLDKLSDTQNLGALSLAAAIEIARLQEILVAHRLMEEMGETIWSPNGLVKDRILRQAKDAQAILKDRIPKQFVDRFGKQIVDLQKLV